MFPVVLGFGTGGAMSVHQIMMVWCFGLKQLGTILGTFSFFSSFAGLLGTTQFAGLHDLYGTYLYSFMVTGGCSFISGFSGLFCKSLESNEGHNIVKVEEVKGLLDPDSLVPDEKI